MAAPARWSKVQLLTAVSMSLMNFTTQVSFAVIAPFFSVEAERKGATSVEVGLIFGAFQLVIFITSPFYGRFINSIGAKHMFISGSLLCGTCNIIFGFLDDIDERNVYVAMCFLCRILEANGASMLMTASFAIMAKQFPDNVGAALGFLKTFSGVGMAIGPTIGGGLYTVGGFKAPFISVGGLVVATAVVSMFVLPPIPEAQVFTGTFIPLLRSPGCIIIFLVTMANTIALSSMDPVLSPFMDHKFHLTVGQIGLVFMVAPGVFALVAPVCGWISDKGWHGTLIVLGSALNGASFLLLGPSPFLQELIPSTVGETIGALVLMGLTVGLVLIPVFPLVIRLAKSLGFEENLQTYGVISGFFNSSSALGAFVGPCVSGYLGQVVGFEWAMTASGITILSLGVVFFMYLVLVKIQYHRMSQAQYESNNNERKPLLNAVITQT